MRRTLGTFVACLMVVAGLAASGSSAAVARGVTAPHHGVYSGHDDIGRRVAFTFGGQDSDTITHVMVEQTPLGAAVVTDGVVEETCVRRICFRGRWVDDTTMRFEYRIDDGRWYVVGVVFRPPHFIQEGHYVDRGRGPDRRVTLTYRDGHVLGVAVGGGLAGDGVVSSHHFDVCNRHTQVCVRGHWQSEAVLVGTVYQNGGFSRFGFEAYPTS
ncbi:hypothetical protein ABLE68_16915 [Nocardioides sp. CN2-186]|uniref:hypothetical protein n=1 Tax=Nocardioides tweenelious TaxID=3156607 RepID=UPI0032B35A62